MSLRTLFNIEMKKFIKKKDWISILAIASIGILFASSSLSGTYTGPKNQSALYWLVSQIFNSVVLFIIPFVMAFMGTRMLATELEETSLKLYIERIQDKRNIYLSKILAFTIYSILVYIITLVFQFGLYQIAVIREPVYFSGNLSGANTMQLILSLFLLWASSFYLPGLLTFMLGTKIKPIAVMGLTMGLVFILRNAFRSPILEWLNPWTYIVKLVVPFSYDTNFHALPVFYWQTLGAFILLLISYTILLVIVGIKLFDSQKKTK